MTRSALVGWLVLTALALAGCGDEDEVCDSGELASRLAAAREGDVVEVGACTVTGSFTVPRGVVLRGQSVSASVLAGTEDAVVRLQPGDATRPTALERLRVDSSARAGVFSTGDGAARVADVTVTVHRGVGIAAEGLASFTVERVDVEGPVAASNAMDPLFALVAPAEDVLGPVPASCPPATCEIAATRSVDCPGCGEMSQVCDACGRWVSITATYGIVLGAVGETALTDVDVRGAAQFGFVALDQTSDGVPRAGGTIVWHGGVVEDNIGVGLYAAGDIALDLSDVSVDRTVEGARALPSYSALLLEGVSARSARLGVHDSARYGIVHLRSRGDHEDLVAERNGDAAVWIGESDGVTLHGAGTLLADNEFAGVAIVGSRNVSMRDGRIERTHASARPVGIAGVVRIGDGVHLIGSYIGISFEGVTCRDNERAGMIVDVGGAATPDIHFTGVTVSGTGAALGAVGGRVDLSGSLFPIAGGTWDLGITREGATLTNDASPPARLDAIGAAAPSVTPDTEGIAGAIAPID